MARSKAGNEHYSLVIPELSDVTLAYLQSHCGLVLERVEVLSDGTRLHFGRPRDDSHPPPRRRASAAATE